MNLEDRLRQLSMPLPSSELRDRIVTTEVVAQQITWSDRIWFSRAWRRTAAAIIAITMALEGLSSVDRSVASTPSAQVIAESRAVEAIGREVGFPQELAASLGRRVLPVPARSSSSAAAIAALLQTFEFENEGGLR